MINGYKRDGVYYELIGGIEIPWPKQPPKKDIVGSNLPKKQQKFVPTPLPKSFKKIKQVDGNLVYSPEQRAFIEQEQNRILEGYWFMNNGTPTYITGLHYFELCYWKIDIGLKEYRDRDRRVHLHWLYCEEDPNCYGQVYMKHRRDGATYRATAANYLTISTQENAHGGIQSKTGGDAGKVFRKMIGSWRKLPYFLQPIHEGTSFPKKSLRFFEPAEVTSKNNRRVKGTNAIESWIDFESTQSEAYDGDKLQFYHLDEAGKTTEADVSVTWDVVKECLSTGNGKFIVGKAMITTTVEELEKKGGANFKKIWVHSDFSEKNENNKTVSGLYRLFIPAYDGLEGFVDEYGYSVMDKAKEHLEKEREGKKKAGDLKGLEDLKRKYPFTEQEALAGANNNCEFDIEKLNQQLGYLETLPPHKKPYEIGNFEWEDGERDTRVIFRPNPYGKFKVAWRFKHENGPDDQSNRVQVVSERYDLVPGKGDQTKLRNIYKPENDHKFVLGIDPYDHDITRHGEGSKAAGYVYRLPDFDEEVAVFQDTFVVQYLHRPPLATDFYEDMLKLCVYFGCQMLYETQKTRIKNYFIDRGYQHFLMLNPKADEKKAVPYVINEHSDVGQAASARTTEQIVEYWQDFIFHKYYSIQFEELLKQLKEFDVTKTEKYDAVMGSGYALIASKKRKKPKPKATQVTAIFPTYNNSGSQSTINPS